MWSDQVNWAAVSAFASVIGVMIVAIGILGGFVLKFHLGQSEQNARLTALEKADEEKSKTIGRVYSEIHNIGQSIRSLELGMERVLTQLGIKPPHS
jgi:hypothetical protein